MMIVRDPAVARRFDLHHRVAQCGKVSSRVTTDQRVRTFRFQLRFTHDGPPRSRPPVCRRSVGLPHGTLSQHRGGYRPVSA